MSKELAFLNGRLVPSTEARVSFADAGFVQGTTVSEQLRTFCGILFQLDQHLQRLERSLEIVGVEPALAMEELRDAAEELVSVNRALLDPHDDVGLSIFVTPGLYPTFSAGSAQPTVGMHTYPLPFHLWAHRYRMGQKLIVTGTRQISRQNWPLQLKCRSRMHYYLADREARSDDPEARALLLDTEGLVNETSTSNVLAVVGPGHFVSPPREDILQGISLQFVHDLVTQHGNQTRDAKLPSERATGDQSTWEYRALRTSELRQADEVLLCSTTSCLIPVASIDGDRIGSAPGNAFRRLIGAWSDHVGLDIVEQAERFASIRQAE